MMGSETVRRRVRISYFVVPILFSVACASANYIQQSFLIYLKYQAMVDAFAAKNQQTKAA
jgi:hypothetical protein